MSIRRIPLLLVLLAFSACGGGPTDPGPTDPPLLNTPDGVIEALRIAWEARDASAIAPLLTEDFEFFLSPNDVEFWGMPASWDRSTELRCSRHVFAGDPGMRPGQVFQAPVDTRFTFGLILTPVEQDWAVTTRVDPPFAGLLARRFDVIMTAQYVNADLDFVGSRNEFYLIEKAVTQNDGSPARQWFIRAWRDLGNPSPALRHGTISWGYFKSVYQGS